MLNDPSPIPPHADHVAVVCPSWVGDTVMCTPVLRALREHRPSARLTALVRPGLGQVLAGAPWLDDTVSVAMKGPLGPWRLGRALREVDADVALLLPNSFRSALAARLGGCARRVGYDRDGRAFLLTHALPTPPGEGPLPTVDYYARLCAAALGVETIDPTVELATTTEEASDADALLDGVDGPFVLLNPGANKPPKRWPAERFARLADALADRVGTPIVMTGTARERPILDEIEAHARHGVVDLERRGVTLGSLKEVVRRAAVLVTNDTGPRHLAAALGTPTVTLYGPTDHRWTIIRGAADHGLLAEPFLPEDEVADRHPKTCAIDRIPVEDVVFAVERMMGRAAVREAAS